MPERYRLAQFPTPAMEAAIGAPRVARLVRRWHGFGTRDELLARVDEQLDPHERAAVQATLARFLADGTLVAETTIRTAVASGPRESAMAPVAALVVPTRASPGPEPFAALARGIAEHVRVRDAIAATHAIVVLDDSPDGGAQCRGMLEPLVGAEVRHVGRAEKEALATAILDELAADAVDPALVRFAMFGTDDVDFRAGANRNCALLLFAGERIVSADDDAVPRISAIEGARSQLRLSSAPDPTEFWCYPDRAAVLAATADVRGDLVALHDPLLGRTVADAAAMYGDAPVDLDDMSPRATARVLAGRGRVAATYVGIVGDSGMASPVFALLQCGAARERITSTAERYRDALHSREVVRGTTAPTLADSGFLMGLAIGLDHRDTLPPFLPVGRNEDHMFGLVLTHACGDALVGCLPHAVLHAPLAPRAFTAGDLCFRETKLADLLRACIHAIPPSSVDGDRREGLRALGRRLVELAASEDFAAALREHRVGIARATIARLDLLVRRHDGRPTAWRRDVERYVATCEAAIRDETPVVADELARFPDAAARTQAMMRRVGELLGAWPEIVAAARRLRTRTR